MNNEQNIFRLVVPVAITIQIWDHAFKITLERIADPNKGNHRSI